MLKLIVLAGIFWLAFSINAQNLIPNPGFERCDQCDGSGTKELNINSGANNPIDWTAATYGTPDFKSIKSHLGKKHGGFFVGFPKYEYLANHFTSCLTQGATYEFSFWILPGTQNPNYIIDEIAVYILSGSPVFLQAEPLKQLTPQFISPDQEFIDHSGYRQYKFQYKATGGEDHFIIGRFKAISVNDTVFVGTKRPANPASEPVYYFVDDFDMHQIAPGIAIDLIPDEINICHDQMKTLSIPPPYDHANIRWSNGDTTATIIIPETNFISVVVNLNDSCHTIIIDSIHINLLPKSTLEITGGKKLCPGDQILLTANCTNCFDLSWSTKVITMAGDYTVTANSLCGMLTETITISTADMDSIQIIAPETICDGDSVILHAFCNTCLSLSWDTLKIFKHGNYTVTANTLCGPINKSITINSTNEKLDNLFEFPNVVFPEGDEKNRYFQAVLNKNKEHHIFSMNWKIFNRWGKLVFENHDLNGRWSPDSNVPSDTYIFIGEINYQDCNGPANSNFKGTFTIIR